MRVPIGFPGVSLSSVVAVREHGVDVRLDGGFLCQKTLLFFQTCGEHRSKEYLEYSKSRSPAPSLSDIDFQVHLSFSGGLSRSRGFPLPVNRFPQSPGTFAISCTAVSATG